MTHEELEAQVRALKERVMMLEERVYRTDVAPRYLGYVPRGTLNSSPPFHDPVLE